MKELIPVGLDIGTGFVKVSSGGKTTIFPSLIGRVISDGRKSGEISGKKKTLVEHAGNRALSVASHRHGIVTRPVSHGLPIDDSGFGSLAREAMRRLGVEPERSVIVLGIPHVPNGDEKTETANANRVTRIIKSSLNPYKIQIIPQAFGTLKSCKLGSGTIINIGHGTTEIISVTKDGYPDGFSIDKASGFVTSQLGTGRRREDYVNYKKLFEGNPGDTARLVRLLALHIADDVARIRTVEPLVLAGGGSQIPGMKEEFEKILKRDIVIPENPVYANAIGYEMIARTICEKTRPTPEGNTHEEESH